MLRFLEIVLLSIIGGGLLGLLLRYLFNHFMQINAETQQVALPAPVSAEAPSSEHLPSLDDLMLNRADLKRLTGVSNAEALQNIPRYHLPEFAIGSALFVALLALFGHDELASFFGIVLGSVGAGLWHFRWRAKRRQKQHQTLLGLLAEVKNYNTIVNNIRVLDQLRAVGNPVKLTDRDKVIKALVINRRDLVRALNTERILRENPDFNPEQFDVDLTALQALQVNEKSSEYSELLDTALKVGVRLQEEMKLFTDKQI